MEKTHSLQPEQTEQGMISSHRIKLLIAFVVLIVAAGYFAFLAFDAATVYYYTVGEMNRIGPTAEDRMVRVSGKLVPETFHREDGSTVAQFHLTDGDQSLSAAHDGVLPDLFFNDHSEIILEGRYHPDGVFLSENVIVKCPSKYIAQEDETG
jgi:cytochrome c-type biogenesis protein CcmE